MATTLSGRWPRITTEKHPWEQRSNLPISRHQARKLGSTYESAVIPPIAAVAEIPIGAATLAELDDASRALTKFDLEYGAQLASFPALLLRSESAASSQIENLTASAKAIVTEEIEQTGRKNAALIVANTRATSAAIELSDQLDSGSIIRMHEVLLGTHSPELAGAFRREQVWIGGSDFGPFNAAFVPPHAKHVAENIEDLCFFIRRDDFPVLAQTAIAHAQFETIHPFPDGNGRTGRALTQAILRAKGITQNITVPISAGLLANTKSYFAALTRYQEGDPEPIVKRFIEASFVAIENGAWLGDELDAITAGWRELVKARKGSAAARLLEELPAQPVVNMRVVTEQFGISASAGARAIDQLVQAGLLEQVGGERRNRKWAAVDILQALDGFSARSLRRH